VVVSEVVDLGVGYGKMMEWKGAGIYKKI